MERRKIRANMQQKVLAGGFRVGDRVVVSRNRQTGTVVSWKTWTEDHKKHGLDLLGGADRHCRTAVPVMLDNVVSGLACRYFGLKFLVHKEEQS